MKPKPLDELKNFTVPVWRIEGNPFPLVLSGRHGRLLSSAACFGERK
jgi:hypothetical protein